MEIKLFFFILSILFIIKNVVTFAINFYSNEPQPLSLNIYEKSGLYLTITYIITFILS